MERQRCSCAAFWLLMIRQWTGQRHVAQLPLWKQTQNIMFLHATTLLGQNFHDVKAVLSVSSLHELHISTQTTVGLDLFHKIHSYPPRSRKETNRKTTFRQDQALRSITKSWIWSLPQVTAVFGLHRSQNVTEEWNTWIAKLTYMNRYEDKINLSTLTVVTHNRCWFE